MCCDNENLGAPAVEVELPVVEEYIVENLSGRRGIFIVVRNAFSPEFTKRLVSFVLDEAMYCASKAGQGDRWLRISTGVGNDGSLFLYSGFEAALKSVAFC